MHCLLLLFIALLFPLAASAQSPSRSKGSGTVMSAVLNPRCFLNGSRFSQRKVQKWGKETTKAVNLGLSWLKSQQNRNGSWGGQEKGDPGLTGLVILSLLADGNTNKQGKYKKQVTRGVEWLKSCLRKDGSIAVGSNQPSISTQAPAACALTEAAMFCRDNQLMARMGAVMQRLQVMLADPKKARTPLDMTLAMMALGSYEMIRSLGGVKGTKVDLKVIFGRHEAALKKSRGKGTSQATCKGFSIIAAFLAGERPPTNSRLIEDCKFLAGKMPGKTGSTDPEYLFGASHSMYQMGGSQARQWYEALRKYCLSAQIRTGKNRGSWPTGSAKKPVAAHIRDNSLILLALEAPWRYSRMVF